MGVGSARVGGVGSARHHSTHSKDTRAKVKVELAVEEACARLLSGDWLAGAVETFERDGFVATPHDQPLLSKTLIEGLKERWERLFKGIF